MYQVIVNQYGRKEPTDSREVVDIDAERVQVDISENGYATLKFYKGVDVIAAFNEWVYFLKVDPS